MIGELTTHMWQSTVFAAVAGLLTLAFRKNQAKVRYWLWLSASLKFFVPFWLLMSLGSHLGWAPVAQRIATPAVSFAMEQITQPFPVTSSFAAPAQGTTNWIPIAFFGLWVCGFVAIALIRLRCWLRIRTAVRASIPLEIPAAVEIRSSPGLLEPGVVGLDILGWSRPILLLPAGIAERLTPPQLEAVLAHELCHVRRRDNLFASVHMIVEAMFWFHPLVWWIGARLVEERERACDEGVLSRGSEPRTYADAILNVCKLYMESPLVCMSGVTGANLKRRIEAIMTNRTGQGLNRAKKFLLAGAGVAALAGPVFIGVVIGAGNAPLIRAQPAAAAAPGPLDVPQTAQPALAVPANVAAREAAAPAASDPYQDRRLVAMLFDFSTMTPDEQSRVRQSAIHFVHSGMGPADSVAVMAVENGGIQVLQDFTAEQAPLESAILKLNSRDGNTSVARLANLETAGKMLGALPEKKALIYFSSAAERPGAADQTELRNVIDTLQKANVAVYPIDARGIIPQAIAQLAPGSAPIPPQSAPAGTSQDEYSRRLAYAQAQFGSPTSAMGRTYIKYGPPDQIEDRSANAQNPSQIWRYNYLENFHSRVEFEFTPGNRPTGVRINWPPPLATYTGAPGAVPTLAEALGRESQGRGGRGAPVATNASAGLPGRHASFQTYPAGELQTLSVPLDSLSGGIDVIGQIKTLLETGAAGQIVANVRDFVQASAGTYQTGFTLNAGSYVCSLLVREQNTGLMYKETINFEVK